MSNVTRTHTVIHTNNYVLSPCRDPLHFVGFSHFCGFSVISRGLKRGSQLLRSVGGP